MSSLDVHEPSDSLLAVDEPYAPQVLSDLPIQEDPSADDRHYWKIAAYCVTGFFVIIFLLTCVLIRRIRIAIACIKVRRLLLAGNGSSMCTRP